MISKHHRSKYSSYHSERSTCHSERPLCHSERSEESPPMKNKILRYAQDDRNKKSNLLAKNFLIIFLNFLSCATFASTYSDTDNSYNALAWRLQPIGVVDVAGQAKVLDATLPDAARPERGGNEIYQQYCIVCHGTGAAGSPKFGSASAWAPRKAKGINVLLAHAKSGFNFMPPRGTCMDCSDAELKDAIDYMLEKSS